VRYLYSAGSIRDHVEAESWVLLAERLRIDNALVVSAVFREPSTASAVLDVIECLKHQYYVLIKMDEHGELLGYIGKSSRPATPVVEDDGDKRQDDSSDDGALSLDSTRW
jgi:hypothetical protein